VGTLGLSIGLGDEPILKGPIALGKLPGTNALPFSTDVTILVQYPVLKGVEIDAEGHFPSSVLWFPN
jgi:hypothetical protein